MAQCAVDLGNILNQAFITNILLEARLQSFDQNVVDFKVSYVISLPGIDRLASVSLEVFTAGNDFGELIDNSEVLTAFDAEGNELAVEEQSLFVSGNEVAALWCLDQQVRDEVTLVVDFQVQNNICNFDGTQAIVTTWFPQLRSDPELIQIDYSLPVGDGLFSDNFRPDFTPGLDQAVVQEARADDNFVTVFLPYSVDDLNVGDAENPIDTAVFLENNVFANVNDCVQLQVDENLSALFVVAVIVLAILGVGCCVISRYYEKRDQERLEQARQQNRRQARNLFRANPDIVVRPDSARVQRTVQAVPEGEDFEGQGRPINTISVHLARQQTVEMQVPPDTRESAEDATEGSPSANLRASQLPRGLSI